MPEPRVAHQFDTPRQQQEADTLGMWIFLATEVMFFGGLILCYTFGRFSYPHVFEAASHRLYVAYGGTNTAVLLCSSLTMAFAVRAAHIGRQKALVPWLLATMALGSVFLVIKGFEYHTDFEEHLVPGAHFEWAGSGDRQARMFFWLYFVLTGLHALHVTIGLGILGVMTLLAAKGRIDSANPMRAEIAGLYWHFVDIAWVFLFPLLYLIGHRQ